ncbi:tetratricopeptide repeat protein [Nocardia amamiensis]|uniref:Tetratricopeptide repeat protein n=1 Tax=Nocardia amamiensis TaxID=404578 RepID=A0ABS0CLP2_9NOCA|nr:tetratricopeptide repeat protein [Nocardia amamiensis]MBF6297522.1 tetratricopeptide repeat protein [Nocardia amamiensis]
MAERGARDEFFTALDAARAVARSPSTKRPLSVKAIARETEVPESTLRSWFPTNPAVQRTVPRDDDQLITVVEFFLRRTGRLAERAHLDRRTQEDWLARRDAAADEPPNPGTSAAANTRMPGWVGLVEQLDAGDLPRVEALTPYRLGATPNRFSEPEDGDDGFGALDEYVARTAGNVDARVATALVEQRIVVITGPSKAGKTRTLFEAARRALPHARVLVPHPDTLHHIPEHPRFTTSTEVIVVWLDNLQDFLTTEHPLTPALLAHLNDRPARTVVAATLRSEALARLHDDNGGELTRDTRAVLDQSCRIELASTSEDPAEQAKAAAAYPSLPLGRHGLAEVLAGAPELLRRYDAARILEPVLRTVIEVAIDWSRIGHPDPIPETVLTELALARIDGQRADLDITDADVKAAIQTACTPTEQVGRVAALQSNRTPDRSRTFKAFDYLIAADDGQNHPHRPIPTDFWHTTTHQAQPHTLRRVAYQAYLRGQLDIAETMWRRTATNNPLAMTNLGHLLERRGDLAGAETWYRRATDAEFAFAMVMLGHLLDDRGDLAEAETWYRRAVDADPDEAYAKRSLGDLFQARGDLTEAETWYRRAVDTDPDDAYAKRSLGDLFQARGDLTEAETWYHRALETNPDYAYVMDRLGDLFQARGDLTEAETWYRRAVDADYKYAMVSLGYLLESRGDLTEAETWYRRAADTDYEYAMVKLGELFEAQGDLTEAEIWYRRAADTVPDGAYAMVKLGDLLQAQGDLTEAETWYRRAADTDPDEAYAKRSLGDLFQARGDLTEAETWYHRALDTDPDYAYAMVKLGDLLKARGDLTEAETWYRRAADTDYAYAMVKLGDLLQAQGDLTEAETWYRRAADTDPD